SSHHLALRAREWTNGPAEPLTYFHRVGLSLSAGLPFPVLSAFMEQHPEIELDLDFTDRLVDVIDEGFDVVIRGSVLRDSRLVSRPLGSWRACLVAAPEYLKRRGIPKNPDDLLNHACLHYRWTPTGKLYQWPLRQSTFTVPGSVAAFDGGVQQLGHVALYGSVRTRDRMCARFLCQERAGRWTAESHTAPVRGGLQQYPRGVAERPENDAKGAGICGFRMREFWQAPRH
ncbi:LysR substrate binding domain-containing protein, partial [Paraburkholderia tropica]